MGDLTCAEVRELAPELALGVLSGQARGDALRHVDTCPACRGELEAFSRSADALLHLAPPSEPASGFEDRVLGRITAAGGRSRRWIAMVAAVAVIAAGIAAGGAYLAGGRDRRLAREYSEALDTLHGTSLHSGTLRDPSGAVDGQVVLYDGKPSWIFVAVERGRGSGDVVIRLLDANGHARTVRGLRLTAGRGAFGGVVSGSVAAVRRIEVVGSSGGLVARGSVAERH